MVFFVLRIFESPSLLNQHKHPSTKSFSSYPQISGHIPRQRFFHAKLIDSDFVRFDVKFPRGFCFPNLEISSFLDLDLWCFVLLQNGWKGSKYKIPMIFFYLKQVEVVWVSKIPLSRLLRLLTKKVFMGLGRWRINSAFWSCWYSMKIDRSMISCCMSDLGETTGWVDLGILEGSLLLLCDLPSSPVINMVIMRDIPRKASVTIQNFRPPFHTSFNFPFAFHEIRSTTLSVPASQSIRHRWSNETFSSWVIPADTMNSMSLAFFWCFFSVDSHGISIAESRTKGSVVEITTNVLCFITRNQQKGEPHDNTKYSNMWKVRLGRNRKRFSVCTEIKTKK